MAGIGDEAALAREGFFLTCQGLFPARKGFLKTREKAVYGRSKASYLVLGVGNRQAF